MRIAAVVKFLAILVATGVVAVAALLTLLWIQHTRPVTLPAPTGPYAVGRADYDWIDRARVDSVADRPGIPRELTVWIWYPAAAMPHNTKVEYLPAPQRTALERHMGPILKNFLTHDLARVRCHAVRGAGLSAAKSRYPVVLFKPGIGALALDYTTLAEDLASHGYIVVASDSPHSTAVVVYRDGRMATYTRAGHPTDVPMPSADLERAMNSLIRVWADDERFLLDELQRSDAFSGRLDLRAIGSLGHSFGGATALEFCSGDARCRAGIDLDGRLFGERKPNKPFLFILSDHGAAKTAEDEDILRAIQTTASLLPNRPARLTLLGSRHFNFNDAALTKNTRVARIFGMLGPIDQRRSLAITADCVRAFFDVCLKGQPESLLLATVAKYPEVRVDQ